MKVTKPVTGSLVERGGYYHTLINAYVNGKRRIISRTTGLPVKNNYRRALKVLEERKKEYDESGLSGMLTMEERRLNTSLLLSEYMTKFVERKKDKLSPVSYEGYTNMIKGRIRRFFDPLGVTIGSLTPQLIEDFLDSIADDGCNSSTQQRYYQIIGCCLKNAVRKDHIDRNPIEKVDRPRRTKFTAAYYSKDEALQLLRCAKGELCYIPVLLGVFYGMRRSEVTGLQWSSVDFENNQIHIDHKAYVESLKGKAQVCITDVMKTDASKRTLPLIPQVREELLKHKARQEEYRRSFGRSYCKEWTDCVCVDPTGHVLSPDFVTRHFGLLLAEHGLRHIRFHDLRHTCASLLVAQGVPMKQIQLWLGHSTYSTTADIYSHLSTAAMGEPANCIADLFTEPENGSEEQPDIEKSL
jgi:integrase